MDINLLYRTSPGMCGGVGNSAEVKSTCAGQRLVDLAARAINLQLKWGARSRKLDTPQDLQWARRERTEPCAKEQSTDSTEPVELGMFVLICINTGSETEVQQLCLYAPCLEKKYILFMSGLLCQQCPSSIFSPAVHRHVWKTSNSLCSWAC